MPTTVTTCDTNPNNYIALFPDYREKQPNVYALGSDWVSTPFAIAMFNFTLINPSTHEIPEDYFIYAESQFGSCGSYVPTDRLGLLGIISIAMGFR